MSNNENNNDNDTQCPKELINREFVEQQMKKVNHPLHAALGVLNVIFLIIVLIIYIIVFLFKKGLELPYSLKRGDYLYHVKDPDTGEDKGKWKLPKLLQTFVDILFDEKKKIGPDSLVDSTEQQGGKSNNSNNSNENSKKSLTEINNLEKKSEKQTDIGLGSSIIVKKKDIKDWSESIKWIFTIFDKLTYGKIGPKSKNMSISYLIDINRFINKDEKHLREYINNNFTDLSSVIISLNLLNILEDIGSIIEFDADLEKDIETLGLPVIENDIYDLYYNDPSKKGTDPIKTIFKTIVLKDLYEEGFLNLDSVDETKFQEYTEKKLKEANIIKDKTSNKTNNETTEDSNYEANNEEEETNNEEGEEANNEANIEKAKESNNESGEEENNETINETNNKEQKIKTQNEKSETQTENSETQNETQTEKSETQNETQTEKSGIKNEKNYENTIETTNEKGNKIDEELKEMEMKEKKALYGNILDYSKKCENDVEMMKKISKLKRYQEDMEAPNYMFMNMAKDYLNEWSSYLGTDFSKIINFLIPRYFHSVNKLLNYFEFHNLGSLFVFLFKQLKNENLFKITQQTGNKNEQIIDRLKYSESSINTFIDNKSYENLKDIQRGIVYGYINYDINISTIDNLSNNDKYFLKMMSIIIGNLNIKNHLIDILKRLYLNNTTIQSYSIEQKEIWYEKYFKKIKLSKQKPYTQLKNYKNLISNKKYPDNILKINGLLSLSDAFSIMIDDVEHPCFLSKKNNCSSIKSKPNKQNGGFKRNKNVFHEMNSINDFVNNNLELFYNRNKIIKNKNIKKKNKLKKNKLSLNYCKVKLSKNKKTKKGKKGKKRKSKEKTKKNKRIK
tara:strand:- start:2361 stop:4904 length:2544 start_codon:yes stop_codon:yes gene_type:complete